MKVLSKRLQSGLAVGSFNFLMQIWSALTDCHIYGNFKCELTWGWESEFMKRKTTLYLEEEDIRELKKIALENQAENMTSLITKSVRNFINEKNIKKRNFTLFNKCKNSVKRNYFGNAVNLQKKLRSEWDG